MNPRSYLALVRAQLTAFLRSKMAVFWSLAFPLGFLFLFGGIMARGNPRAATYMLPGLLATMLTSGSLFGIAIPMVLARATGVLRRFRVTPPNALPLVRAYTRDEVDRMFGKFSERRTDVRQLTRAELHVPRIVPDSFIDGLGSRFGWNVIMTARK